MTYYQQLDASKTEDRRTIEGLQRLRTLIAQSVPVSTDRELLLATWNIREFSGKGRGREAYYYIAEVISAFDMVAVQEVQSDLSGLRQVMRLLGGNWEFLVTDVTEGTTGGSERIAILYDVRKVAFSGFAGELVMPPGTDQAARTPFLAGFTAGWAVFSLAVVHIIFGSGRGADQVRAAEIDRIGRALQNRAERTARKRRAAERDGTTFSDPWAENVIWLGDFNIYKAGTPPWEAMEKLRFTVPDSMTTNLDRSASFDQIAILHRPDRFGKVIASGVVDWPAAVFRLEDEAVHAPEMGQTYAKKATAKARTTYYRTWRTFQLSDHLPRWTSLTIDYSDEYLQRRLDEADA